MKAATMATHSLYSAAEAKDCLSCECYHCFAQDICLVSCCQCNKTRCKMCTSKSVDEFANMYADRLLRGGKDERALDDESIQRDLLDAVEENDDAMISCRDCAKRFCMDCSRHGKGGGGVPGGYVCERCCFTTKPCTNPNCPNEVGVPTKRRGGCRRSRYCSKECQVVKRSEHQHKFRRFKRSEPRGRRNQRARS